MKIKLTTAQYWAVIVIAFGLLIVNGWLVYKLLNDEVPKQCPVPVDEINFCDCVYNALGDQSLRYCTCFPGTVRIDLDKLIEVGNGSG